MGSEGLLKALERASEVTITVKGRRSGRRVSLPVWFVKKDNRIHLLPVMGTDTNWFKNVMAHTTIEIEAGGHRAAVEARPITERSEVERVVEMFREKYGASQIRRYYSKLDACVEIEL